MKCLGYGMHSIFLNIQLQYLASWNYRIILIGVRLSFIPDVLKSDQDHIDRVPCTIKEVQMALGIPVARMSMYFHLVCMVY